MTVYLNRQTSLWKLVFFDEKHKMVRLLQWVNGAGRCEYTLDLTLSMIKNEAPKLNQTELEWFGADYTMDQRTPMVGKWKLNFIENGDAASHFMELFNDHIAGSKISVFNFDDDSNDPNTLHIRRESPNLSTASIYTDRDRTWG